MRRGLFGDAAAKARHHFGRRLGGDARFDAAVNRRKKKTRARELRGAISARVKVRAQAAIILARALTSRERGECGVG
jgi:hypothetical protein